MVDGGASFKDHFSKQAETYARFRPDYPADLYAYLATLPAARELAWDCATGSGQAALGLARYFRRVIATDGSAAQIANAAPEGKVQYRVAPAEQTDIGSDTVDLITVAQALHWFDAEAFYAEARRVLVPGGVLAVWSYALAIIDPAIDAVVQRLYEDIVGRYWPEERRSVEAGYGDVVLPGEEIATPNFAMTAIWRREQLLGYLRSWSAVQRYIDAKSTDPVALVESELAEAWDGAAEHEVRWPLSLRVARVF